MATISFDGIDEYGKKIAALGKASEGVCKYAIYDAAGIVADAIRDNTPVDTGNLRDSVSLSPMRDEDGFIYTKVYFGGYDDKGTPNMLKARAIESGTSKLPKKPFVRPAVNRVKQAAQFSMEMNLTKKIEEIMKEG